MEFIVSFVDAQRVIRHATVRARNASQVEQFIQRNMPGTRIQFISPASQVSPQDRIGVVNIGTYDASGEIVAARPGEPGQTSGDTGDPFAGMDPGALQPVPPAAGLPEGAPIGGTDEPTEQSFRSQYRRALDERNLPPRARPFRAYLHRQEAPTFNVFQLQRALGQQGAADRPQEYVGGLAGGQGGFGAGLTNRAGAAWSELLRQRGGGAVPTAEPFLEADPGADAAEVIGGVARRAARQQYGTWGASFLPSQEETYQRYLAQPAGATGTDQAYIDYLRNAWKMYR